MDIQLNLQELRRNIAKMTQEIKHFQQDNKTNEVNISTMEQKIVEDTKLIDQMEIQIQVQHIFYYSN